MVCVAIAQTQNEKTAPSSNPVRFIEVSPPVDARPQPMILSARTLTQSAKVDCAVRNESNDAIIRPHRSSSHHKEAIVQHFKASDGLQLAYTIDDFTDPWTSPPTLLLLHAAMGHAKRYYAWVPRLSRHYRVVRMDLRGHGHSHVPPAEPALTMARLVKDAAD